MAHIHTYIHTYIHTDIHIHIHTYTQSYKINLLSYSRILISVYNHIFIVAIIIAVLPVPGVSTWQQQQEQKNGICVQPFDCVMAVYSTRAFPTTQM
jgi:hypothetical protein